MLVGGRVHGSRKRRPSFVGALIASFVVVFVASSPRSADAREPEHVRVVMPDKDNLQYLAFWVAKGGGLFRDEGIDIEIAAPSAPPGTIALMSEHNADVFVLPPPLYIQLIADKFPLLVVANLLQNDPINVVVRRSVMEERKLSPSAPLADRIAGLRGLRVGVAPGPLPRLRALFAAVGLDADKDIEMVVVRGHDQNAAFAANKFDALYCHTPYLEEALVHQDAVMLVNQSGGEVVKLAARQIHALVVTQDLAKARADLVFSLVRAVQRAETLVHRDHRAAVDAVMREHPSMERAKVEAIVAIYDPAIPITPRVSVDGIAAALALFPATRTPPDLSAIDLHDYIAPAFAERAISDDAAARASATDAPRPFWRRRAAWVASALAMVMAMMAMFTRRRRRVAKGE